MNPILNVSPIFYGYFSNKDLLSATGSIAVKIVITEEKLNGLLIGFYSDTYFFEIKFENNSFLFCRNKSIVSSEIDISNQESSILSIICMWDFNKLILMHSFVIEDIKKIEINTPPIIIPFELYQWAKKQNLIETLEYNSKEEFRSRVHSILLEINEKMATSASYQSFYNTIYEGQNIKERKPKRETDIQPLIHALISDVMYMSGIQVIPESKSGIGSLDFHLLASISGIGICSICVECKLSSSADIKHGLLEQLPKYMEVIKASYGVYLVFDFENFSRKKTKSEFTLDFKLNTLKDNSSNGLLQNIRIIFLNFEKPPTASK